MDVDKVLAGILYQAQNPDADIYFQPPFYIYSDKEEQDLAKSRTGRVMNRLTLRGTTFSGHPTKTTLGNTMRSILYYRFIAHKAGVEADLLVAGDDVVMW